VRPVYSISNDIVVVNAHGEVFPVPPGYHWSSWVDQISLVVQTKGVIWVQVAGYPFYYYSQGSYSMTEIGVSGFQRFLQRILGPNNIECWPIQEGCAVPLLGGYSNRLWGYGLINGGLHEGRPLKISSSTNLADLLDVMGYWSNSTLCLTLGLIGFSSPNQNIDVSSDQRTGYYVHNGAHWYDSDYNKGKYSMAVAAWPKISQLASGSSDIYYSYGPWTWWMGTLKCQVAWSRAEPPASSGDPWKVTFVTITTAFVIYYPAPGPGILTKANSPLKLTSSTSGVTFEFNDARSTKLLDASENNWQNTIRSEMLSTAISILLIPFTGGWTITQKILLTVAIKFASQILKLPFQSPQPVTSGPYIDLAVEDLSDVVVNIDNYRYKQLEAIGVIDAYIPQSQIATPIALNFLMGQRCAYLIASGDGYWCEQSMNLNLKIKVEPRTSGDCNQAPQTPKTPAGPNSGFRYATYIYSTSTTDPEGDDVRYIFYWGDGSSTTTGYYESGNTVSASHQWSSPGTYVVYVQAQDSQGGNTLLSQGLTVTIVNRAPNTPSTPSGPTLGYVYTTYAYSTTTVDPDGDNVRYEFDWGDGSTTLTGWYASGAAASAQHSWTRPGTYQVKVRAQDVYGLWSGWSGVLAVSISQNDAGTGGDAGNTFAAATSISPDHTKAHFTFLIQQIPTIITNSTLKAVKAYMYA